MPNPSQPRRKGQCDNNSCVLSYRQPKNDDSLNDDDIMQLRNILGFKNEDDFQFSFWR